jgi:hypothetical protein
MGHACQSENCSSFEDPLVIEWGVLRARLSSYGEGDFLHFERKHLTIHIKDTRAKLGAKLPIRPIIEKITVQLSTMSSR